MTTWTKAALQTVAMMTLLSVAITHAVDGDTITAAVVGLATLAILFTL